MTLELQRASRRGSGLALLKASGAPDRSPVTEAKTTFRKLSFPVCSCGCRRRAAGACSDIRFTASRPRSLSRWRLPNGSWYSPFPGGRLPSESARPLFPRTQGFPVRSRQHRVADSRSSIEEPVVRYQSGRRIPTPIARRSTGCRTTRSVLGISPLASEKPASDVGRSVSEADCTCAGQRIRSQERRMPCRMSDPLPTTLTGTMVPVSDDAAAVDGAGRSKTVMRSPAVRPTI